MSTVNVGNSTNNPVPVTVNAALPAGGNTIGNVNIQVSGTALSLDASNNLKITQSAAQSVSATLQNAQTGNANGTSLNVLGMASVVFTMTVSSFTGTVNFEGSEDNSNWSPLLVVPAGGTSTVTTATAAGQWTASCAGLQSVRARTSGVSAGNTTVTGHAVPVSGFNVASGGGGGGGTSSSFGSAFPGTGTAIGASDGSNMQSLLVESSSNKNLRIAIYNGATEVSVTGSNALKVDGSAVTQPVSIAGNQAVNLTQIGGNATVTGGANGLLAVGGPVASGASNADNPVKIGGAYNSTQPTVTNAQMVDAQYSARGAALVATGVDTFNVTVNAALPSGSNNIGIVTLPANNTTMVGVTSPGGVSTTAIAAAATNTVVKSSAGRLCRVLVTASGTATLTFYDNATGGSTSGNILGVVPANAATGSVYDFQFYASTGIQAPGGANTPAVTVGYI